MAVDADAQQRSMLHADASSALTSSLTHFLPLLLLARRPGDGNGAPPADGALLLLVRRFGDGSPPPDAVPPPALPPPASPPVYPPDSWSVCSSAALAELMPPLSRRW